MRKVVKQEIRVTVYPRSRTDFGWASFSNRDTPEETEKYEMRAVQDIMQEINRHVDGVGSAHVEWDLVTVCGYDNYCVDDDGNVLGQWPGCCIQDQIEFFNEHQDKDDEWFMGHGMDDLDYLDEFRAGKHTN